SSFNLLDLRHPLDNLLLLAQIEFRETSPSQFALQLRSGAPVAIAKINLRPLAMKFAHCRFADPIRATRQQHNLVFYVPVYRHARNRNEIEDKARCLMNG